jgi:signal transduction histidine kinase
MATRKIFISYRRGDSADYAHMIYTRLADRFPNYRVYLDVDTNKPEMDWMEALDEALGQCDLLLALIGPLWGSENGYLSRLHDPLDFVRLEISTGLLRGIRVEISVSDRGSGIAPDNQETIFEEFRQVGTDYSKKREGTGLGLTLTRKFVELHGGKIWVESEVGKGSTFTFTLPVKQ